MSRTVKESIINLMVKNDRDWYAVWYKINGKNTVELKHHTALSNILQCGEPLRKFNIVAMYQCGLDTVEDAYQTYELGGYQQ